jgi:8-oxo-dGTP diphosphatase
MRRQAVPGGSHKATRQRVASYGLCQSEDGLVLLVRAARSLTVAGQWFLPGGGLEHGEDPVTGLRREFAEETGLDVEVGRLLGVLSDTFTLPDGASLHTVRIIYRIDTYRGSLRDEVKGSSDIARWVGLAEALELPLRPYVRQSLVEWSSDR